MNGPIDIIIPWVDGSDPEWQAEKEKYMQKTEADADANSIVRYQSWDNLQYLFRGIEKFMPWVNKVYFVTWGHLPEFLNADCPKLQIVRHEDFIPKEYLPTFNANVIESNFHRIEGLSENYIYFNDDMFPLTSIAETYYFKNDKVCDEAVETPIIPVDIGPISSWGCAARANNVLFINKHFKKQEVIKKNRKKWFTLAYGPLLKRNIVMRYWHNFAGFHDPHVPSAFKKQSLKEIWDVDYDLMNAVGKNRFRSYNDVTQYMVRYWQLCKGDFYPRRTLGKCFYVDMNNYKYVAEGIRTQKWQMICMNENCEGEEFEKIKIEIAEAFETILPEKCSFEK